MSTPQPSSPAAIATRVHLRHFSKSLPMSLLRAREAVMRQFRPSLRAHGITEQQWRVLRALTAVRQIDVAGLARATFLLGPSLSRILSDLEDRGFIAREASPADGRRGLISITEAGTALIALVTPRSEATYRAITDRFGTERLAALQTLLRELEEAIGELESENTGPDARA
jgi:homoprotocatechuate degradation regulator HpaR